MDGLKLIAFNVQKHIAALDMCHNPPLSLRQAAIGAHDFKVLIDDQGYHFDDSFVSVVSNAIMQQTNANLSMFA